VTPALWRHAVVLDGLQRLERPRDADIVPVHWGIPVDA
jgi:hypothetical protein